MPYSRESKEKETHPKETKQDNASLKFQRVSQGGAGALPPDEEGKLSASGGYDRLFALIREAHLEEAQEFRLKGFNSQVPEVDGGLLTQLRDDLSTTKSRQYVQASVGGPLGSAWLLDQIGKIERFTDKLSDDVIKRWVKHELPRKNAGEAVETELGSRRTAQSLARRLESTLQTLIRVVHTLRAIDDYSTSEKRHDMLVAELIDAFSPSDKSSVIQALSRMTVETSGHAAWASLIQARTAAWKAGKSASVDAMITTSRHEAEKANKKARELQGESQTFFSHVAAYLQSLSRDLEKASIGAEQIASSPALPHANYNEVAASLSRSHSLSQRINTGFDKKKLQAQTAVAGAKVHAHRLVRILKHGHLTGTPTKDPEHVVADTIIRSILWQWQQPAIKIQYASAALLSKMGELKKIEGILASHAVADDRGGEQARRNTAVNLSSEDDLDAQLREWVSDSLEQENPENQRTATVATLERLLGGDIASARELVERLGKTEESVKNLLRRQRFAVLKMIVERLPAAAPSLKAVDKLLPDMASDLTASIAALDNALQATESPTRDFSEAIKQAGDSQLLAIKVKESLSAESARLTERPLDEHSRGARLAKHWANLAKEQNVGIYPPPDAQQGLFFLKKQGLLAGTLSTGDPAGYLFATRLAGELENAANNELRLPMSPEQYAALEKGLVEYIVKWGQRRISRGVTRIVIELSFEQALDTVSFNVSSLFRLPYKVLKTSIKIPYNVNRVNNYTMPGHDKPYKAIYGLLGKKLTQLGFNLLTAPVPGVIKFAAGAGVTAGAALHNLNVGKREKTFSAVYQHVVEGKQSEKIKMDPLEGMIFDSVFDTATTAAVKGGRRVWQTGRNECNVIFGNAYAVEQVNESSGEMHTRILPDETLAGNYILREDDAAAGERVTVSAGNSSALQPQTDTRALSDEHNPVAGKTRVRQKRELANNPPPKKVKLNSDFLDFESDITYQKLSPNRKKQIYLYGIQFLLLQIENDERLPQQSRYNASLARIGHKLLVPVSIEWYKLTNTVFLPDSPGEKSGVLISLDSYIPYYYVNEGKDLLENIELNMPYNSKISSRDIVSYRQMNNSKIGLKATGIDVLTGIRNGKYNLKENFNIYTPKPMDIAEISEDLVRSIEIDYMLKEKVITNSLLISRAIAGANGSDSIRSGATEDVNNDYPEVTATKNIYHIETTWENMAPADYLNAFSKPFSSLAGNIQLVTSHFKEETIQDTEQNVQQAEEIGAWADVTVGAITSFIPAGLLLNTAQAAADIAADLTEGKGPDSLAIASLVTGCIPAGRIVAKVGKLTHSGGKIVKYGLMLGGEVVDLTILGRSIKTAVDTGEPLAIYQALLASGMSIKNSYDIARNMSSELSISKKIEESASLKELEALQHDDTKYSTAELVVRTFQVGRTEMLGRINHGEIEVSRDNGGSWKRGGKIFLLMYRLQNAGWRNNSIQLNGRIYRNHNVTSSHAQELELIKKNKYEIHSLEQYSAATVAQKRARIDFEAGEREYNLEEFSQFDSLSFSKKIEGLKWGAFKGQALTHRQIGALWKKAHNEFWEDQAYKQVIRGQEWLNSAKKNYNAIGGEVSPQGAYLRGKNQGECEPATILMARARREGMGNELSRSLMGLIDDPDNVLGSSLNRLRSQPGIKGEVVAGLKLTTLETSEQTLFPGSTEKAVSVRLELKQGGASIRNHVVLLSRSEDDRGNYIYSFFDPNYGYVEFGEYKDMANFVKKRVKIKRKEKGGYENLDSDVEFSTVNNNKLDEVTRNIAHINNGKPTALNPIIYKEALTFFLNQQNASGMGDPSYTPYLSAFNSLPENQDITIQQVKDLKYAFSASGNNLVEQAKYQYALLAYLSGPRGIQLPIDTNEIRNRIVQEIDHADYVYGWKVKEIDELQSQLKKSNTEKKVADLRNEIARTTIKKDEWLSKKKQASLRLDMWNDSWPVFFD
uniref:hypothetical protein n=1 Tax=Serratia proteamaculans TaxID=28151 RepID=UPI001F4C42ED|nr:hypothetical protein [Serratia proteamaculans]ULG16493.1 hypothetical protein 1137p_00095 [Serratia proteamaculans]